VYIHKLDKKYKLYDVKPKDYEEWPSEKWNFQDKLASMNPAKNKSKKSALDVPNPVGNDESAESVKTSKPKKQKAKEQEAVKVSKKELKEFLISVEGIGKKKVENILEHFGSVDNVLDAIHNAPDSLVKVEGLTKKLAKKIKNAWQELLK